MPPSQTARLRFREMSDDDLDAMALLLGDSRVAEHFGTPKSRDHTLKWIHWNKDNYKRYGYGLWIVETHGGEFIGDCGLTWQPLGETRVLEVGYHVRTDQQRLGYATEAASACMEYARVIGAPSLSAIIRANNIASRRVAEKVGLRLQTSMVKNDREVVVYGAQFVPGSSESPN